MHTPTIAGANPATRALAPDVKLREVWAWSMYDFANSAYTTVVITAVFSAYFVGGVAREQALGHVRVDRGAVGFLRRDAASPGR